MPKKMCRRDKCIHYREHDGCIDCYKRDEGNICVRELNEEWSCHDYYEKAEGVKTCVEDEKRWKLFKIKEAIHEK